MTCRSPGSSRREGLSTPLPVLASLSPSRPPRLRNLTKHETRSPAVARKDALQPIAVPVASKIDDFYFICEGVCDFLLIEKLALSFTV